MANYMIKTMTRDNLNEAISWAASEGWNPGLHDADCFYAADPTGFFMGFLEGEPISAISVVKYGTTFGFLGFYIVKPDFRGQGYGLKIWQTGLETLKGRMVGLDGVVAQQSNYLKSGFQLAYRNIRYEGLRQTEDSLGQSSRLFDLNSRPLTEAIAYDKPFFPDDRTQFLRCWLTQPESHAVGLLHHDRLGGYGLLRRCRTGYKIGPLFADTAEFADEIFQRLMAKVPMGSSFYLDVPEVNAEAVALARRYGLQSMFETARMYAPQTPELPVERIYGVTSFELG